MFQWHKTALWQPCRSSMASSIRPWRTSPPPEGLLRRARRWLFCVADVADLSLQRTRGHAGPISRSSCQNPPSSRRHYRSAPGRSVGLRSRKAPFQQNMQHFVTQSGRRGSDRMTDSHAFGCVDGVFKVSADMATPPPPARRELSGAMVGSRGLPPNPNSTASAAAFMLLDTSIVGCRKKISHSRIPAPCNFGSSRDAPWSAISAGSTSLCSRRPRAAARHPAL